MSKVPISPLGERVVATTIETESKTASGLYLPESAKEKSKIAEVKAIGDKVKGIKLGDKIIYKEYSTNDIKIDGVEYLIIKEEDILGIVL